LFLFSSNLHISFGIFDFRRKRVSVGSSFQGSYLDTNGKNSRTWWCSSVWVDKEVEWKKRRRWGGSVCFQYGCVKRKGTRTQHRIPQPSLVPFLTKLKIAAAGWNMDIYRESWGSAP
jgi:hypothetical protein